MRASSFMATAKLDQNAAIDPNTKQGYTQIFKQDVKIQNQIVGTEEEAIFLATVYIRHEADALESVKLELSTENSLHFVFEGVTNKEEFETLKAEQGIKVEFQDFPNVLVQQLQKVHPESTSEFSCYLEYTDPNQVTNDCKLCFVQELEFSSCEILAINLERLPLDTVKPLVQYRFDALRARYQDLRIQLKDFYKHLQKQAPKVYATFKKDPNNI